MPWVGTSSLLLKSGDTGLTGNLYTGLADYEEMSFLLHFLRDQDLFIDVGANLGSYSILAGGVVGAECVAFEPHPLTCKRLERQALINEIENISVIQKGVGDENGVSSFSANYDTMNRVILGIPGTSTVQINITTLDSHFANLNRTSLVKIDVEGYEQKVLKGARNIFTSDEVQAIIIETNGSTETYDSSNNELSETLASYGFTAINYLPKTRTVQPLGVQFKRRGNTIYVKSIELASRRCLEAPLRPLHLSPNCHV